MEQLRIPSPDQVYMQYPHQLSGGLKQRIVIAMALITNPRLLIADEPSTALDVTVQAQIMRLFRDQAIAHGIALILITHDLGVVAQVCDKISVMYAGNLVEYGDVETIFKEPKHPYTKALLACIPVMGMERGSLSAIDGNVPNALNYPSGCRFHTRCQNVTPLCKEQAPQLIEIDDGAKVACHNY
jgi:oligopeptide/dipeptide ABC transporter ATP-binding protein